MSIAPLNPSDPIIDAYIKQAKKLTTKLQALHTELSNGSIAKRDLSTRYAGIYKRFETVIRELKPAAYAKFQKMKMPYEEAAPLKVNLDNVTAALKNKHRNLISYMTDLFHENRIQLPMVLAPACYCTRPRIFVAEHIGWIVSGSAAFISLMTLTPLGEYLGPTIAQTPKFFGNKCRDIGRLFTEILSSPDFTKAAQSTWAVTLGEISGVIALSYPTYRSIKQPVAKLVDHCDKALAFASEHPMTTFLAAWVVYYLGSDLMGFQGTFAQKWADPAHVRLFFTFGLAFATPSAASTLKMWIDSLPKEPLPPIAYEKAKWNIAAAPDRNFDELLGNEELTKRPPFSPARPNLSAASKPVPEDSDRPEIHNFPQIENQNHSLEDLRAKRLAHFGSLYPKIPENEASENVELTQHPTFGPAGPVLNPEVPDGQKSTMPPSLENKTPSLEHTRGKRLAYLDSLYPNAPRNI